MSISHLVRRSREVFVDKGWTGIGQHTRRKLASWLDPSLVTVPKSPESSAVRDELDRIAAEMRILYDARSFRPDGDYTLLLERLTPWYQRVELPDKSTTTSDPRWAVYDGAPDNSLGRRLAPQEAATLRPLPKWRFIQRRLPAIKGRTVLEIGSNCGFFSFEFAKLGAAQVTGVEAIHDYVVRAEALRRILGSTNVRFLQRDWCLGEPLPQHDIVFSSEAVGHFAFPFFGLYRMLAAARKYAVVDLGVHWAARPTAYFELMLGYSHYHAFSMSDSLLTDFLVRCGVHRSDIRKHPYGNKRCLYVVSLANTDLRVKLESADDPLWSGLFTFNPEHGAEYHGS